MKQSRLKKLARKQEDKVTRKENSDSFVLFVLSWLII